MSEGRGSTIGRMRLWKVSGPSGRPDDFWEERLVMPLDIHPEHRSVADADFDTQSGPVATSIFVELETTDGATGIGGPIDPDTAHVIDQQLRSLIEGADALANERLWDRLYRSQVHGRKGVAMMAISVVDCAMWDLKGRILGQPVVRLLGGPTRDRIPAYASTLGFSVDPERAAERARAFVALGYRAMKWFYRHGPSEGREGMLRNERLVAAVRDAVGPDVDIM